MERWSVWVEAWREYWRLRREWREAGYPPHGEPLRLAARPRLVRRCLYVGVGLVMSRAGSGDAPFGPVDKRRLPWREVVARDRLRGRWQDGDAQPDRAGEP